MKKVLFIAVIAALGFTSCGGGDSKPAAEQTTTSTPKVEEKTPKKEMASDVVEIKLESNDQMKFNLKELKVPAGSKVKLTLVHTGSMAKAVMGHNFVLLAQGTDIPAFAAEAVAAGPDKSYIPEGDAVIAHTSVIGGGESTSVTFDAPATGTYDFICSFPAHYGIMNGKFIVE